MPIYVPGKVVLRKELPADAEADAYIAAVEAADGQALEPGVKFAIKNFVLCCKQDGIWDAIKASCILAGARTLTGALVPLVGTAPTNFNFVSGDYNRKTGLVGDGSTKYLNLNRTSTDDPQNNSHASVYISTAGSGNRAVISALSGTDLSEIGFFAGCFIASRSSSNQLSGVDGTTGFVSFSRSSSNSFAALNNSTAYTHSITAVAAQSSAWNLYRRANETLYSSQRLAFYSIGTSLSQTLLRDRVTDLINAFAAAIP